MQILKMIESGNITAAEGSKLLEAVGPSRPAGPPAARTAGRWIRIRVQGHDSETVNVNLPLQLAEAALRLVPKNLLAQGGVDLDPDALMAAIAALGENAGKIVEVKGNDGEVVEIYVE